MVASGATPASRREDEKPFVVASLQKLHEFSSSSSPSNIRTFSHFQRTHTCKKSKVWESFEPKEPAATIHCSGAAPNTGWCQVFKVCVRVSMYLCMCMYMCWFSSVRFGLVWCHTNVVALCCIESTQQPKYTLKWDQKQLVVAEPTKLIFPSNSQPRLACFSPAHFYLELWASTCILRAAFL